MHNLFISLQLRMLTLVLSCFFCCFLFLVEAYNSCEKYHKLQTNAIVMVELPTWLGGMLIHYMFVVTWGLSTNPSRLCFQALREQNGANRSIPDNTERSIQLILLHLKPQQMPPSSHLHSGCSVVANMQALGSWEIEELILEVSEAKTKDYVKQYYISYRCIYYFQMSRVVDITNNTDFKAQIRRIMRLCNKMKWVFPKENMQNH